MCHCGELDSGLRVLGEMQDAGVQPDVTTFNTLLASASYHVRHLSSISGILEWHGRSQLGGRSFVLCDIFELSYHFSLANVHLAVVGNMSYIFQKHLACQELERTDRRESLRSKDLFPVWCLIFRVIFWCAETEGTCRVPC